MVLVIEGRYAGKASLEVRPLEHVITKESDADTVLTPYLLSIVKILFIASHEKRDRSQPGPFEPSGYVLADKLTLAGDIR